MYKIFSDNNLVYSGEISNEAYGIIDGSLELKLNESGRLSFTIPEGNEAYDKIETMKSVITLYDDDKLIFKGRVFAPIIDLYKNQTFECEGEFSYFCDTYQEPFTYNGEIRPLLEQFVSFHNTQVDESKQFTVGRVTVRAKAQTGLITRSSESYRSTMEALKSAFFGTSLKGYMWIRHEGGVTYLDYLEDFSEVSDQRVIQTINLMSAQTESDSEGFATVIVPIGARIEDEEGTLVDYVTVKSENDGKIYIEDPEGVAKYGRITKVVQHDAITVPRNLLEAGGDDLENALTKEFVTTLTAVDLSKAGFPVGSFSVGTYVNVVVENLGINEKMLISGLTIDLLAPEKNTITIGESRNTLTSSMVSTEESLKQVKMRLDDAVAEINTELFEFAEAVRTQMEELQDEIDGNVTTWYYPYAPTLYNMPAQMWTTDEEKNNHIGDLFYDSSTGYAYRFMAEGLTWVWTRISDEDISAALRAAQAAQDTADEKRRVFTVQPRPPYDVGDLWLQGANGDLMTCTTPRATGSYVASDWVKLNKYTDDTLAQNTYDITPKYAVCSTGASTVAKTATYSGFVLKTGAQINVRFTNQNTASAPTLNINNTGAKVIQAKGSSIVSDSPFSWKAGAVIPFVYDGTYWQMVSTNAQDFVGYYDDHLDQTAVFNKLTNNGQAQGIFKDANGNLYVNMTYLQGGIARLGGANNGNGALEVFNSSDGKIIRADNTGIYIGDLTDGITNAAIKLLANGGRIKGVTIEGDTINVGGTEGGTINVYNSNNVRTAVWKGDGLYLGNVASSTANAVTKIGTDGSITTSSGTITGGAINGADIKAGGSATGTTGRNGKIEVYNSSNSRMSVWDNSGLYIGNVTGTDYKSTANFKVSTTGAVTVKSLTATGGAISGSTISGSTISSSTIKVGGSAGGTGGGGVLEVYSSSNALSIKLDGNGVNAGYYAGMPIENGGTRITGLTGAITNFDRWDVTGTYTGNVTRTVDIAGYFKQNYKESWSGGLNKTVEIDKGEVKVKSGSTTYTTIGTSGIDLSSSATIYLGQSEYAYAKTKSYIDTAASAYICRTGSLSFADGPYIGYVTDAAKELVFFIPSYRRITGTRASVILRPNVVVRTTQGKYINGTAWNTGMSYTNSEVSAVPYSNGIKVTIEKSTAYTNVDNNTPVTVSFLGDFEVYIS